MRNRAGRQRPGTEVHTQQCGTRSANRQLISTNARGDRLVDRPSLPAPIRSELLATERDPRE